MGMSFISVVCLIYSSQKPHEVGVDSTFQVNTLGLKEVKMPKVSLSPGVLYL